MKRDYTKLEEMYRRLLFSYLHYNGNSQDAMKRSTELLKEAMDSDELEDDFKLHFKALFKDQASKLYATHENWAKGLKMKFESALE